MTLDQNLDKIIQAYAKHVTEKKVNGEMRIKEGKNLLTVQGHLEVCKKGRNQHAARRVEGWNNEDT